MPDTFASSTFASDTFDSGSWTGLGADIIDTNIIGPPCICALDVMMTGMEEASAHTPGFDIAEPMMTGFIEVLVNCDCPPPPPAPMTWSSMTLDDWDHMTFEDWLIMGL